LLPTFIFSISKVFGGFADEKYTFYSQPLIKSTQNGTVHNRNQGIEMFSETGQRLAWISHFQGIITKFGNIHFLTTEKGRDCFQRKQWHFLGDSTTTELMHDIALLLSRTEEEILPGGYKFPRNSIDTDETNAMVLAKSSPDRETTVRFYENHRNMTTTSDKIFLRHRFIRHRNLNSDRGDFRSPLAPKRGR
jgi:hypothetical protein